MVNFSFFCNFAENNVKKLKLVAIILVSESANFNIPRISLQKFTFFSVGCLYLLGIWFLLNQETDK